MLVRANTPLPVAVIPPEPWDSLMIPEIWRSTPLVVVPEPVAMLRLPPVRIISGTLITEVVPLALLVMPTVAVATVATSGFTLRLNAPPPEEDIVPPVRLKFVINPSFKLVALSSTPPAMLTVVMLVPVPKPNASPTVVLTAPPELMVSESMIAPMLPPLASARVPSLTIVPPV